MNTPEYFSNQCKEFLDEWLSLGKNLIKNYNFPFSGDVLQYIHAMFERVGQLGFFNINIHNSTNPSVEYAMLAKWSYGRQLGRIIDILGPMVEHMEKTLTSSKEDENEKLKIQKAIEGFNELKNDLLSKQPKDR